MELTVDGVQKEIKQTIHEVVAMFKFPTDEIKSGVLESGIFEETIGDVLTEDDIDDALKKVSSGEVSEEDAIHSFQSFISFHVNLHVVFMMLRLYSDRRSVNAWDDPVKHGLLKN